MVVEAIGMIMTFDYGARIWAGRLCNDDHTDEVNARQL